MADYLDGKMPACKPLPPDMQRRAIGIVTTELLQRA